MKKILQYGGVIPVLVALHSCSSFPLFNKDPLSVEEAYQWLNENCSRGPRETSGDVVAKANTREFKGRYPATLKVQLSGKFVVEVTNILGGTMAQLQGDGTSMDVLIPAKPKQSRRGLKHYLGLDPKVLSQFFMGDLPCPLVRTKEDIETSGGEIIVNAAPGKWTYKRTVKNEGEKPVELTLKSPQGKVVLSIQDWDPSLRYAKKAKIVAPEGELEWTWRNRSR